VFQVCRGRFEIQFHLPRKTLIKAAVGDHYGQFSQGYRWPYGPVGLVTPFNFPLEIPVLQLMGALYMGNKPVLKPSEQVSVVMEQFVRLLIHCGMDPNDLDLLNCRGPVVEELIVKSPLRVTQFTGSSKVAEHLSRATNGKVKILLIIEFWEELLLIASLVIRR